MIPGWQMEAYERLRTEIVALAVRDYKSALRKTERIGAVCIEQKNLEKWFLSKWGQLLSGDNGEYIIEKCHKNYKPRSCSGRKEQLPEDVQKQIYREWQNRTSFAKIHEKYGVSHKHFYQILRRWDR